MSSFWLSELQRRNYKVEDALAETALADLGKKYNFGLYVVRAAIAADAAKELLQQSKTDMAAIAANTQNPTQAVALQGNSKKGELYNTLQACAGGCRCKYIYEGTVRHQVYGLNEVEALERAHHWLHDSVSYTHLTLPTICSV